MASQASLILAQEMYVAYYGRPADPEGLAFWCIQFDLTDNLDNALDAFGNSPEFQAGFAGLTDTQLINNLYVQMFNHNADPEGLAFYLARLESGEATLATIAKQIADGAQALDRVILDNKIEVANFFTEDVEDTASLSDRVRPNPERQAAGREIGDSIRACLRGLLKPRRMAVVLYLQGESVGEASQLLGWNTKRVNNLVYRGLADLRTCLRSKGVEP